MTAPSPIEGEDAVTLAPPRSAFGWLVDGLGALGSLLIALVMLLVCADVASRNLANRPITGVTELVALSIVTVLFLQLASALRHGRLSRAEIFIDRLRERRPRVGAALQALLNGCGAAFTALVAGSTVPMLVKAWQGDDFIGVEGVFTAPTWPVHAVVVAGAAVAAIQYVLLAFDDARQVWRSARAVAPGAFDKETSQ